MNSVTLALIMIANRCFCQLHVKIKLVSNIYEIVDLD
jgi:hypothetical protein